MPAQALRGAGDFAVRSAAVIPARPRCRPAAGVLLLLVGCTAPDPGPAPVALAVTPRHASTASRVARLEGAGEHARLIEGVRGAPGRAVAQGVLPRFAYSPDGRSLVFARLGPGGYGEADLWVLDLEGGGLRQLTDMPGAEEAPRFVGRRTVELVGTARGLQSRFRISLDGGVPVQVTNVGLAKNGPGLPAGYVSPWGAP